ncbi:MAG: hypothetical protein MI923_21885, partial [Phycisphaerales bacterium]|nr:hypothetical protein [Phycisphaerales bacterium]
MIGIGLQICGAARLAARKKRLNGKRPGRSDLAGKPHVFIGVYAFQNRFLTITGRRQSVDALKNSGAAGGAAR